jgi:hypothetical protein
MVLAGCALAVWFAAGALAGDAATLQLSNGSAITGNVTAADADSITIDKKRHALADVIGVDWGGPFGPPSSFLPFPRSVHVFVVAAAGRGLGLFLLW